jgi:adenylate kinase family enzyme
MSVNEVVRSYLSLLIIHLFLYICSQIGRVDVIFYLDCEEYYCTQRLLHRGKQTDRIDDNLGAISRRITFFKDQTLPVVKFYDDLGRVFVVSTA